jgi:predicted RNA-binding Zn-ribbon protein involved in translation (DUF1610 family)
MSVNHPCPKCSAEMEAKYFHGLPALRDSTASAQSGAFSLNDVLPFVPFVCTMCGFVEIYSQQN